MGSLFQFDGKVFDLTKGNRSARGRTKVADTNKFYDKVFTAAQYADNALGTTLNNRGKDDGALKRTYVSLGASIYGNRLLRYMNKDMLAGAIVVIYQYYKNSKTAPQKDTVSKDVIKIQASDYMNDEIQTQFDKLTGKAGKSSSKSTKGMSDTEKLVLTRVKCELFRYVKFCLDQDNFLAQLAK